MFFCPSVRYKGVGFYLPSLGEGVVIMSLCLSVRNKGVCFYLPSLGEGLGGYHVLLSFCQIKRMGILSFCQVYAPKGH